MPKRKTRVLGYARVSTDDQNLDLQVQALEKRGVEKIFEERGSAWQTQGRRPVFKSVLKRLREGDTLVVWKLDRLGRNLVQTFETLDWLRENEVTLESLTENINVSVGSAPMDKFLVGMLTLIAQHESDQISYRTKAGIEAKRKRGEPIGRKHILRPAQKKQILKLLRTTTKPIREIADQFNVSQATINNVHPGYRTELRKAGKYPPKKKRKR